MGWGTGPSSLSWLEGELTNLRCRSGGLEIVARGYKAVESFEREVVGNWSTKTMTVELRDCVKVQG